MKRVYVGLALLVWCSTQYFKIVEKVYKSQPNTFEEYTYLSNGNRNKKYTMKLNHKAGFSRKRESIMICLLVLGVKWW